MILRCRWRTNVSTGECTVETFDPICDIGPACREFPGLLRKQPWIACTAVR